MSDQVREITAAGRGSRRRFTQFLQWAPSQEPGVVAGPYGVPQLVQHDAGTPAGEFRVVLKTGNF